MDVEEDSIWYLLSSEWLNIWKDYVGYEDDDASSDVRMHTHHPGMILNDDILDDCENILIDKKSPHLNFNLKENLREDEHYHIVSQKVWDFLFIRYGGIEVQRFGTKIEDSDECTIEVNLLKISVHYFPGQQEEDEHVNTIFESRHTTLETFKERLAELKNKESNKIKLWKAPIPSDFEQFYRNNLCEFKKHRQIILDAELLKSKSRALNDIHFTQDDFLIVECRCASGFIFEEVERPEVDEDLNDKINFEDSKDSFDPLSMKFIDLDFKSIMNDSSHGGR
jgi:hypothetical protein